MKPRDNPLTRRQVKTVDLDKLGAKLWRKRGEGVTSPRVLRRLFRRETAAEWVGQLEPGVNLWGFSKGQFSLLDVYRAILEQIQAEAMAWSTWTISRHDLTDMEQMDALRPMLSADRVARFRLLIDFSFQRRQPALIAHIRKTWGEEAIRITRNHAKFGNVRGTTAAGDVLNLVVRTSMNLNANPRLEDVEIRDDPELYDFLDGILDDIWGAHDARKQIGQRVKEYARDFTAFQGAEETADAEEKGPET